MNMEIYFTEVSDTSGSITNDLLGLVSKERQERAKKFRFDIDRKLSVYSELLVRYVMAKDAAELLDIENPTVIADTGYYNGTEIKKCIDDGMSCIWSLTTTGI